MEYIAQIFGMTFIGIIVICLGVTIVQCITGYEGPADHNKKLLDNMNKIKDNKLTNK
jgi:hypothetical protein